MSVCLLNYRVDGTTFWNQFFISALRDAAGNITNYVGVQCKVSDQYAANVCKKQEEEFANADAAVEQQNANPAEGSGGMQNSNNMVIPETPSSAAAAAAAAQVPPPQAAATSMDNSATVLDGNGDATMQSMQ